MSDLKAFGSELDDSLDTTTTTLFTNWPASMSNGQFVDGEDDIFDNDEELERILEADNEAPEEIQIGSETFPLPTNVCTSLVELDGLFSIESWKSLERHEQQRLMTFLPNFGGLINESEQLRTVKMLLSGENFKFGNPVDKFKTDLVTGKLSPDHVKMTKVLQKSRFRKYKSNRSNYGYTLLRDILSLRKKLLESRTSQPAKTPLAVLRMKRKSVKSRSDFDDRVAKRYFKELNLIKQGEDADVRYSSEDENFPNGPPPKVAAKKEVSLFDSDYWQSLQNGKPSLVSSTPATKSKAENVVKKELVEPDQWKKFSGSMEPSNLSTTLGSPIPTSMTALSTSPLSSSATFQSPIQKFDDKSFFSTRPSADIFLNSSFESLLPKVPVTDFKPIPNLMLSPTNVLSPSKISADLTLNRKPVDEFSSLLKPKLSTSSPPKSRKAVNDLEVIEEAVANIPGMDLGDTLAEDFDLDFCFNSVEQLEKSPHKSHNRSGGSIGMMSPPLMSTAAFDNPNFACFFSLLRDKFRLSIDYKMSIEELEEVVAEWENLDASQIPWFSFSTCWTDDVRSAVAFLINAQPNLAPPNFSPFLNCCDLEFETFQWIGTGRDADLQLQSICHWWLEQRHLFSLPDSKPQLEVQTSFSAHTSPMLSTLPNTPLLAAVTDFHPQERERMYNPSSCYTYRLLDFSVMVGPIRGVAGNSNLSTTPSKGKNHPLLVADRPPYVTIIVLVRDAVARLKNGEGTRQNICELVKESQFINQEVAKEEKTLTSAVSGALDRLQGETDPCCKYDTSKKTWQFLHQGRSAEDFIRIHNEHQLSGKSTKSKKQRKSSGNAGAIPSPIVESLTTTASVQNNPEDVVLNAVNSILPTEPLQRSELPAGVIQISRTTVPQNPPTSVSLIQPASTSKITLPSEPLLPVPVLQNPSPTVSLPAQTAATPASVQVIQVMTSQGLKTFRLTSNKTQSAEAPKTESPSDPILKIQQPLPIQIPVSNPSLLRAKLPVEVMKSFPSQQPQQMARLIPSGQLDAIQSVVKVTKPETASAGGPPQQHLQNVQRVIVKDSQGKPIQISAEAFQKLLANRSVRPAGQPQQSANLIRIQRPQNVHPGGDGSVVQVVQRPIVKANEAPRQTVVKIQGNLSNLSQQQLQTVQLLSSGAAGTGVRILQASQPASPVVLPTRLTSVSSPVTATPSSIVSIGGRQFILANRQVVTSTVSTPTSTTPTSSGQFIVQSSTGKPIVLSQEQLQQFQSLQNVRIVQAVPQHQHQPK